MPVHVGVDNIGEALEHFASGIWVFDAKFRFDRYSESDLSAKADDIHKMYTYRDALIGCRGAYAVYPGDAAIMYSAPTPDRPTHVNQSIAGRDGIGSVANRVPWRGRYPFEAVSRCEQPI